MSEKTKNGIVKNNNNSNIKKKLPEKIFEVRNSLLTDLFETNPHIKTIKHIFMAVLITLLVNTIAYDYYINNELRVGMHLFYRGFAKIHYSLVVWIFYHFLCSGLFLCFNIWAKVRLSLHPKSNNIKILDVTCVSILVVYNISCFIIPTKIITYFELPEASAAIILAEQVRLLMKQHAFVRESAKKVLAFKPHSDKEYSAPKFSQFVYFLFAPTLVYRDEYPRAKTVRWDRVVIYILEFFAALLFLCFIFLRFLNPMYEEFGMRKFTAKEILVSVLASSIPSTVLLILVFYSILHCIQNLFAEILCFGDRMYYKDWWTCSSYQEYFRTWNIIVHDWLYTYIYKDVYEVLTNGNKYIAKLSVFIVSALVHEWAMINMFRFFFPVMFIQFLAAALISFVPTPKCTLRNIMFWYELFLGCGIMASMYTLEFYARINLPKEYNTWQDYLLPKCITCQTCYK